MRHFWMVVFSLLFMPIAWFTFIIGIAYNMALAGWLHADEAVMTFKGKRSSDQEGGNG